MNDDRKALESALARAQAELSEMAERTRTAYREYMALSHQQDAKADEIRELQRALRVSR